MKRIAFASHVALIRGKEYDGIGNVLIKTLSSVTDNFIFVRHSMDGLLASEVRYFKKESFERSDKLSVISKSAPLRYLSEVLSTVYYFLFKQKVDVFVGIDPLNALAGVILRKIGRVDKVIFYTADYSPHRFEQETLNKIYHLIDGYCVKQADTVWSVSSKIVEIRSEMGLVEEKNIFLPNVPPVEFNAFRTNEHDMYNLIMYGILDKQLDFHGAIRSVAELKETFPEISLTIVGNGPEEENLRDLAISLDVTDRVLFKGRLPLEETLKLTSKSGIGLALYTGTWGFNQYGDSTKCREYFNYGLPVISTDTHSTVDEIKGYGAGIVVDKSIEAYTGAVKNVLDEYNEYSKNSYELGRKYEGIHRKVITDLLTDVSKE